MAKIMIGIIIMMSGIGYWYYTDTQNTIAVLTANNAKLNLAVATNEETIKTIEFFGKKILGKKINILGQIPFKKKISNQEIKNLGKLLKI